jgi:hypothetical protein
MVEQDIPRLIRIYTLSNRFYEKFLRFLSGCYFGFWLGILNRDTLHLIDQRYYDDEKMYHDSGYNNSGLFIWEMACIEKYFTDRKSILLLAAGGGREILALHHLGFEVDGYECHPGLLSKANELMASEENPVSILPASRDHCPKVDKQYDALIIGWAAYTLIQGRDKRVALLRELRACTDPGSPLLLSFLFRTNDNIRFRMISRVGNFIRLILRRKRIELGDNLIPVYVHDFTEAEIAAEMCEAGFKLEYYSIEPYGHAVGIAE